MPVIAIIGMGPGLGIEIARTFGHKGFTVAMVARNINKLNDLGATLRADGIEAEGFVGDITRPESIVTAIAQIKERFGTIDVLEFSPADPTTFSPVSALEVTAENLQPQLDFYLTGAIEAVRQIAPDMIAAGAGTILITTGGGSIAPAPVMANINIASAGLRNWTLNLHNELRPHGIYVAHIGISAWIGQGHPGAAPDVIARSYLELYETREEPELHYIAYDK